MTFPIDIACNDPDNGLFDFRAPQIQIGEAEFECKGRAPRFVQTEIGFRLSGKNWETSASTEWIGNWCWNRYVLACRGQTPLAAVSDFVHHMRHRGFYQCVNAGEDLFSWFNDPDPKAYGHTVEHWIRQEYN